MVKHKKRENSGPARQFLIRLPLEVDAQLEADARRCRRSKTRQVEAILMEFYEMESTDLQDPRSREKASASQSTR